MNQNVSSSIEPARTLVTIVKDFPEHTPVILRHLYFSNHLFLGVNIREIKLMQKV